MSDAFHGFLAAYTPQVRELALAARALVLQAMPGAVEQVDPPSRIIAYGFGTRYQDLVCAIAPYASHINLIFARGATLPDPADLLTGTGKRARHVRIQAPEDLAAPALRSLIETAVALR